MSSKDRGSLLAILDSIERINTYVAGIRGAADYYESNVVFDATLMNFITIGEMVDRVSEELKARHTELNWQKVKDFRNLVAHDYLGVDAEEVWQIIRTDLPILKEQVKKILSEI